MGYMAIQSFGTNTGQDAAAALHSLHAQGASAYVIDLRGNSGGLVSAGERHLINHQPATAGEYSMIPRQQQLWPACRASISPGWQDGGLQAEDKIEGRAQCNANVVRGCRP